MKNTLKSEFEENDIDTNHTEEVNVLKLVKMCRSIVRHFKHSEVLTRILHEKQKPETTQLSCFKVKTRYSNSLK